MAAVAVAHGSVKNRIGPLRTRAVLWIRRIGFFLLLALGLAAFAEAASRLAHRGIFPLLPYVYRDEAAFLPTKADFQVAFPGYPPVRYQTDAVGLRVGRAGISAPQPGQGVLVVGDSQALGYMMPFENTFGAGVARSLTGDALNARLLAAPATNPDAYPRAVARVNRLAPARWRLAVVTVNLGNDLDEMGFEPRSGKNHSARTLGEWALNHSFAYMDLVVFRQNQVRGEDDAIGLNPILLRFTPADRVDLVRRADDRIQASLDALQAASKVVLIVPSDYQVDPRQLLKYRHFYKDQKVFQRIVADGPIYAAMMKPLDNYLAERLRRRGVTVVQFSDLARQYRGAEPLFDAGSHHLTPVAHALVARALVEAVTARHDTGP